jgi:hypothetical protein
MSDFNENIKNNFNIDFKIVKTEMYDANAMDKILSDTVSFSKLDIAKLRAYKKHNIASNKVQVIYHYGKGMEHHRLGRIYAKNNIGLQSFNRTIRNALLQPFYTEIDCENAHFRLMLKIGADYGVIVDNIKYYCDYRELCLSQVSENRKIAKFAFLKCAFCGNVKEWNNNNDDASYDIEPEGDISRIKAIEKERDNLMAICWDRNKQYHNLVSKKKNPKASLFAYILQTEELKTLMAIDDFMKLNNRDVDVLIHDGCMVRKINNNEQISKQLLYDAEQYVLNKTGHAIKLINKPIENNYDISMSPKYIYDDKYAAKKFIHLLGDKIRHDGDIYIFNELTGLWDSTKETFLVTLDKYDSELTFEYNDANGKTHSLKYGGHTKCALTNANILYGWLSSFVPETSFIKDNDNTSQGKLLFNDGIFDFEHGFTKGFNHNIIFQKRIKYNFPTQRNEELIKYVNKILFIDAFDLGNDDLEVGEYLKKALATALVGDHRRKRIYWNLGAYSCGKGVLTAAMRNTFQGYVCEFSAEELIIKDNNDISKSFGWLKDVYNCRIAFSHELKHEDKYGGDIKLDGNLIKKVSGGGDAIMVRGLFENQKEIVNKAVLFLCVNKIAQISPADEAIQQRFRVIRYRLNFVNKPIKLYERKANDSVKNAFNKREIQEALIFLMWDTYKNMTYDEKNSETGNIIEPKSVIEDGNTHIVNDNDKFVKYICEAFDITDDDNDYVDCKVLSSYMKECDSNLSDIKIGKMFNDVLKLKSGRKCGSRVRFGIRPK